LEDDYLLFGEGGKGVGNPAALGFYWSIPRIPLPLLRFLVLHPEVRHGCPIHPLVEKAGGGREIERF